MVSKGKIKLLLLLVALIFGGCTNAATQVGNPDISPLPEEPKAVASKNLLTTQPVWKGSSSDEHKNTIYLIEFDTSVQIATVVRHNDLTPVIIPFEIQENGSIVPEASYLESNPSENIIFVGTLSGVKDNYSLDITLFQLNYEPITKLYSSSITDVTFFDDFNDNGKMCEKTETKCYDIDGDLSDSGDYKVSGYVQTHDQNTDNCELKIYDRCVEGGAKLAEPRCVADLVNGFHVEIDYIECNCVDGKCVDENPVYASTEPNICDTIPGLCGINSDSYSIFAEEISFSEELLDQLDKFIIDEDLSTLKSRPFMETAAGELVSIDYSNQPANDGTSVIISKTLNGVQTDRLLPVLDIDYDIIIPKDIIQTSTGDFKMIFLGKKETEEGIPNVAISSVTLDKDLNVNSAVEEFLALLKLDYDAFLNLPSDIVEFMDSANISAKRVATNYIVFIDFIDSDVSDQNISTKRYFFFAEGNIMTGGGAKYKESEAATSKSAKYSPRYSRGLVDVVNKMTTIVTQDYFDGGDSKLSFIKTDWDGLITIEEEISDTTNAVLIDYASQGDSTVVAYLETENACNIALKSLTKEGDLINKVDIGCPAIDRDDWEKIASHSAMTFDGDRFHLVFLNRLTDRINHLTFDGSLNTIESQTPLNIAEDVALDSFGSAISDSGDIFIPWRTHSTNHEDFSKERILINILTNQ